MHLLTRKARMNKPDHFISHRMPPADFGLAIIKLHLEVLNCIVSQTIKYEKSKSNGTAAQLLRFCNNNANDDTLFLNPSFPFAVILMVL